MAGREQEIERIGADEARKQFRRIVRESVWRDRRVVVITEHGEDTAAVVPAELAEPIAALGVSAALRLLTEFG